MMFTMPGKKVILNLRLEPEIRDQFALAAKLRGASMSGLLHQFIIRTIREEKEMEPQAFKKKGILATSITLTKERARKAG